MDKFDYDKVYRYSVLDIYRIKRSNLFWYVVDFLSCKFKRFAAKPDRTEHEHI